MNGVMTWRRFTDAEDGTITVNTYETPVGKEASVANSTLVSSEVVSRARAIIMLREGPTP